MSTKNTTSEFEYYIINAKFDKPFPLVGNKRGSEHTKEYVHFRKGELINNPQAMEFVFVDPIPRKPIIGDYFSHTESVVSEKIKNVLIPININGIQIIPATVESNKGDVYKDFYYIHICNIFEAMDREKSDYEQDEDDEDYFSIESFILDEKMLSEIPLKDRLIFKLKEDVTMKLYHKSVVEAIMETNPEGVQFIPVKKWRF